MSLWQHKNIHKRHLLWAKLFGICLFFHLIFLFWVFCVYRDNSYILSISINKKLDYSAPIMFVPLGVPHSAQTKKSVPIPNKAKPLVQAKAVVKAPAPIKPAAVTPKTTTIAAKPITVAPVTPQKPAPPVAKKIESIPSFAKASKGTPAPADVKEAPKIEPKKISIPVEKIAITEQPKEIPTKTVVPQEIIPPVAQALDTQQTVVPIIPENAHISHNYREVEALRRGAQLQKELVQQWKPPFGVSPDCMCEISFFVNSAGKIEDLKMVKSSGVVMYDISARQALFAMTMPQWTHGKPLIINFKQ